MTVGGQCTQGMTVAVGNQMVRQDKFTIRARLFDLATTEPVWVSSTRVQRNGATDNALFDSLAKDVLRVLSQDGVVRSTPPSSKQDF
jgi:hypothetical protein